VDLDVFDAQDRLVAVAAKDVQDLVDCVVERAASGSISTRASITASSGRVSSHEVCSSVTARPASWASRATNDQLDLGVEIADCHLLITFLMRPSRASRPIG